MDRNQILLVGLPLFLLISDVLNLFTPPPPKPRPAPAPAPVPVPVPATPLIQHQHQPLDFPTQKSNNGFGGAPAIGFGNTVNIDFCASCSYKGTAVTMKNMLEAQYPGINVVLANYPPALPKRVLGKLVPVLQFGLMGIIMGGEQIFPRLGYAVPPQWYYSLRANRFGSIATTWLLGNVFQSTLQSSGAFEVQCNGEPVFSKLKLGRFPGEIELKDLVGQRITNSRVL